MIRKNLSYLVIRLGNGIVALLAVCVFSRLMSTEQYGVYSIGLSIIAGLSGLLYGWINHSVGRLYPRGESEVLGESWWVVRAVSVFVLVFTACAFILSPRLGYSPELPLVIGLGVIAMGKSMFFIQVANSQLRPLAYGLLTLMRGVSSLIIGVGLFWIFSSIESALLGVGIGCILAYVLFGFKIHRTESGGRHPVIRGEIISYGKPLIISAIAVILIDLSGRFSLLLTHGSSAVSGYAIAVDATQLIIGSMTNVFFISGYPQVVSAWESGNRHRSSEVAQSLRHSVLFFVALFVGIFCGAPREVAAVMFGSEMGPPASEVIPLAAIAIALACIKNYVYDVGIFLIGKSSVHLAISVLMALVVVGGNLLLTPQFGPVGAAASLCLGYLVGLILSAWLGGGSGLLPSLDLRLARILVPMASLLMALGISRNYFHTEGFAASLLTVSFGVFSFLAVSLAIEWKGLVKIIRAGAAR